MNCRRESIGRRGEPSGSRCWICGSGSTHPFKETDIGRSLVSEDLTITDSRYGVTLELERCRDCGFVFARQHEMADLVALYEDLEDSAYEQTQDCRARQMRRLLDRARQLYPRAKTVLDVGAAAGLLVAEARRAGYEAPGVEPSRSLVDAARRMHGVELIQGVYPHPRIDGERFDVIFLVDVVEHVGNPLELLKACRDGLSPEGILVVVTPDVGSVAARVFGHRWWHYRLAHVGYFNRRSMIRAAATSGLEPVYRCRPTWYFRAKYLAQRLQRYLPIAGINKRACRGGVLRRLYETVIPVNPRDSMLVALRRAQT